ncbi:hypothetical protein PSYMO_33050, partial [Pseudomonas amygdali pv. mori str. 301020]
KRPPLRVDQHQSATGQPLRADIVVIQLAALNELKTVPM